MSLIYPGIPAPLSLSTTFLAMAVMPTGGVKRRISWLIRDRKSVCRLTASALAFITKRRMILLSSSKACSSFQLYPPSPQTQNARKHALVPYGCLDSSWTHHRQRVCSGLTGQLTGPLLILPVIKGLCIIRSVLSLAHW